MICTYLFLKFIHQEIVLFIGNDSYWLCTDYAPSWNYLRIPNPDWKALNNRVGEGDCKSLRCSNIILEVLFLINDINFERLYLTCNSASAVFC